MEYVRTFFSALGSFWLRTVIVIGIAGAVLSNSGDPTGTNAFEGWAKSGTDGRSATLAEREKLRDCDAMQREGWALSEECKRLVGRY